MAKSKEELQALKIADLRKMCKTEGLDTKGLKSALVQRLFDHLSAAAADKSEEAAEDSDEVLTGCVKSWKKKGFGFIAIGVTAIEPVAEGEEKPEEIFCHRDAIVKAEGETFDALRRGMCVQFKKGKGGKGKNKGKVQAQEVKNIEGEPISWFQQSGEQDREYYDEGTHDGIIGKFDAMDGIGYVLLSGKNIKAPDGTSIDTCTKLSCRKHDFLMKDNANLRAGREIKFKLYKIGEKYGATYITNPEGEKLEKEEKLTYGKEKVDEEKRYKGRVLSFSNNNFGFIKTDDDLTSFGGSGKVYFQAEEINTSQVPPFCVAGQEVSFTIIKDKKSVKAKNVSAPNGGEIKIPKGHEPKSYEEIVPRESFSELEFEGSVANYFWDKGFGMIKVNYKSNDVEVPAEVKTALKDDKVYFRWSDIKSDDKIIGINKNQKVKFNLYKDARGYGAESITDTEGEAISGADRSKADKPRRRYQNNRGGFKRRGGWRQGGRGRRGGRNWGRGGGRGGWGNKRRRFNDQPIVSMYGIY